MTPPPPPAPARPAVALALGAAAGVALALLALRVPAVRFVDVIGFSARAEALLRGERLVDGLYPVGYPALLALGHTLGGDVLVVAKAVSVVAGAALVAGVARALGAAAGAWLLAQTALLIWGATEGTDLPAAALTLAALGLGPRPAVAGAVLGLACLVRYPAVAGLPALLLLVGRGGAPRALAAFVVATAPHWATALLTSAPLLPQQDLNVTIGAGHAATLWSLETLRRWPVGFGRAAASAFVDLPTWLGVVGLGLGLWRRDRRAVALLALALTHLAVVALGFANPRLVLPATLAVALGAAWVPARVLLALALGAGVLAWGPARASDPAVELATRAAEALTEVQGPVLADSPWVYRRREGWLVPAVQLGSLVASPATLTPPGLAALMEQHGFEVVVLDLVRTRRTFPALAPLLDPQPAAGWRTVGRARGWRVLAPTGAGAPPP